MAKGVRDFKLVQKKISQELRALQHFTRGKVLRRSLIRAGHLDKCTVGSYRRNNRL